MMYNQPLELWAGIECTVNRIGDTYHDQLERSGHDARIEDLDLLADLGIRALRYPVLWERTAPDGPAHADWSWPDARLSRLRALGVVPIVGLVHHGSGPRQTSLIDASFATGLAEYARAVAARYPWLDAYTPVNEPLTTARFSGLYGYWYPHGRDDRTFVRALLTQCRATVLAMNAIRQVNPSARLIQTEDVGRTISTLRLAYQAEFENERRWLSFDLLCGRVDCAHPLWEYLRMAGADDEDLEWFLEHPCPPDVLGINHYVTSERFLDHRLESYPAWCHGGNGREPYADVEAVRVQDVGLSDPTVVLLEAWDRYHLPLALTEVHLGSSREEQLRWLAEKWHAAVEVQPAGVDVRAVTVWSALGAFDWNSLVTRPQGCYEPGIYDLRAPRPRPTALATLIRQLSSGERPEHPVLATPGWWRRLDRILYPARAEQGSPATGQPILIVGPDGILATAFERLCGDRGLHWYRFGGRNTNGDLTWDVVTSLLDHVRPWAVVSTWGDIDIVDTERTQECWRDDHGAIPVRLAVACAERGIRYLTFSSDAVFDGTKCRPYLESDPVRPVNIVGRTQAERERLVQEHHPEALVVRTSACFGPWDEENFVIGSLRCLASGHPVVAASDEVVSPTYTPDLVSACLDLLVDGERGLWHLTNSGAVSWADLARQVAEIAGIQSATVEDVAIDDAWPIVPHPRYRVLDSERGNLLPSLDSALAECLVASVIDWRGDGRTLDTPMRE